MTKCNMYKYCVKKEESTAIENARSIGLTWKAFEGG